MNQNHLCSKHKELDIDIIVDLFFGSQERCSPRGRSSAATAMHELIPAVLVDQLSGVLFWSFSKSPGECCPVWGHPLDAGFFFCYLEVCQTTGEKSEGRNMCSRKLPDPKIFRHTTLDTGKQISETFGNLNDSFSPVIPDWQLPQNIFF